MASNSFGTLFKITTWGESHGKAVGVVIDGCPAGLEVRQDELIDELLKRAPGKTCFTSPRKEKESAEILSGIYLGKTTGAPISIIIPNKDVDSSKYESIKEIYRPGHANYTYLHKYGTYDPMGGGRASARETACRVAAGYFAKKLLRHFGIEVLGYLNSISDIEIDNHLDFATLKANRDEDPIFCPDKQASLKMQEKILQVKEEGDSLGGSVGFIAQGLPIGLGDPVYEKLHAKLAYAFLSIPASKSFEIGSVRALTSQKGSYFNDQYELVEGHVMLSSNNSGGVLGGISSGMPLEGKVFFKPTSSIKKEQKSVTTNLQEALYNLPEGSRHDPVVAIRAVYVVEAMLALVLADALMMNRLSKL